MTTWNFKPRGGWSTWTVWLLLYLQENHRLVAFAGDADFVPVDDEGSAGVGVQEFQQTGDEPAIVETIPWLPQSNAAEGGGLAVVHGHGHEGARGAVVEGDRARMIRRAKSAFRIVTAVLLLVTLARIVMINGQAALKYSALRLRRLHDVLPTAETLAVTVGTPESQRLWAEVEALLPEVRQTLSLAEAEVTTPGFFLFGRLGGQYRELMDRIHDNVKKVSEAITALHRNARDKVEAMAKSIPGSKSNEFAALEDQLGKALGPHYAKAFVTFVESQEAQEGRILHTASHLIVRSYKMPVFTDERDKALLVATIQNVDQMKWLLSAREAVQRHIKEAKKSCVRALASTLRAGLVAAEHEYRTLFKGIAIFFERPEFGGDENKLIRHDLETARALLDSDFPSLWEESSKDLSIGEVLGVYAKLHGLTEKLTELSTLPEKQVVQEGHGDERLWLQEDAFDLMSEATKHAKMMSRRVQDAVVESKQRHAEAQVGSFCPNVLRTFELLMERLRTDAQENAQLCRQVADQLGGDMAVGNLFGTLMTGLTKDTVVSEMHRGMQAVLGYIDLLQIIEKDISVSLAVNDWLNVDKLEAESSSAKLVVGAKDEIANELAALREVVTLPMAAEGAARISEAVSSAAFAQYDGIVLRLEQKHNAARSKAEDPAKQ
ncbi:hypothetical protein ACSSS7_005836 [Eimeria intestinalis]